jgi:hypothetical protein
VKGNEKAKAQRDIEIKDRLISVLQRRLALKEATGQVEERPNGLFGLFGKSQSPATKKGAKSFLQYNMAFNHKADDYLDINPSQTVLATNKADAKRQAKNYLRERLAESKDGFRGERNADRYNVDVWTDAEE